MRRDMWRQEGGLKSQIENAGEERTGRAGWRTEGGFKSQIETERTGREEGGGGWRED